MTVTSGFGLNYLYVQKLNKARYIGKFNHLFDYWILDHNIDQSINQSINLTCWSAIAAMTVVPGAAERPCWPTRGTSDGS